MTDIKNEGLESFTMMPEKNLYQNITKPSVSTKVAEAKEDEKISSAL